MHYPFKNVYCLVSDNKFADKIVKTLVLLLRHLFQGGHGLVEVQEFVLLMLSLNVLVDTRYQVRYASLGFLRDELKLRVSCLRIPTEQHCVDQGSRFKRVVAGLAEFWHLL